MNGVRFRFLLLPAAIFGVVAIASGCAWAQEPIRDLEKWRTAHSAYGAARLNMQQAVMLESSNPADALKRWVEAAALLDKALQSDPGSLLIAEALVGCRLKLGQLDKAITACEKAVKNGSPNAGLVAVIVEACAKNDKAKRGIALAERYLKQKPPPYLDDDKRILAYLAALYLAEAKSGDGIKFFSDLLKNHAPESTPVCISLCTLLEKADRGPEAEKRAQAFLKDHPDAYEVRLFLANFQYRSGQTAVGVQTIRDILNSKDLPLAGRLQTAQIALMLSSQVKEPSEQALILELLQEIADKTTRELPDDFREDLLFQVAHLHVNLRQYDQAEAIARDLNDNDPDNWRRCMLLAEVLWENDKAEEAVSILRSYADRMPRGNITRRVRLQAGMYLQESGQGEAAIAELRKNLAEQPDDPQTCNHLGYLYAERNENLEEAVRLVKIALKSEPENAAYLDSLGWAYYKMALRDDKIAVVDDNLARLREAGALLQKASELAPGSAEIESHVGDFCYVEGRLKDALKQWRAALKSSAEEKLSMNLRRELDAKIAAVEKLIDSGQAVPSAIVRPFKPPSVPAR